MTPSIYVIQKSTGTLYCVTKQHYEEYKTWYDLYEPSSPVEPVKPENGEVIVKSEEPKEPLSGFDVVAYLSKDKKATTTKATRIKKEK